MKLTPHQRHYCLTLLLCASLVVSSCIGGSGGSGLSPNPGETDTATNPQEIICANSGATTVVCEGSSSGTSTAEPCPFVGHTNSEGYGFTCTTCPSGFDWLGGTWMFFQNLPGDAPFVDVIKFEANRFTETIVGEDQPGEVTTAVIKGYYFCPPKSEYSSLRKIFIIESVEPTDGLFGNHVGDSYPCDILDDGIGASILLWCDYEWTGSPPLTSQFEYCREGKAVNGTECILPPL
jgi:hypothetical protein